MKITHVEPLLVDRFLFVQVHTDAGITGLGESGAWGHLEASSTAIEKFGAYLLGKDPRLIEYHWNMMHRFGHFRGAAIMGAISALDIALWDIKAKALSVPVYELLGGKYREKARVYGHVKAATIEEMVRQCLDLKGRGFTAIGHLNPFLDEDRNQPYFKPYAQKMSDAIDNVRQLREAVGNEVDLCIEIHRRLSSAEAVVFARGIESFHPMFYEDPIRPDNYDAMAKIAEKISIPIATGERFMTLYEFQMLLARDGVQFVRASICLCGGLTGARKIAALAESHNVEVVPHNPLSPVSLAACLQLDACIPNFAIQEFPTSGPDEGGEDAASILRGEDLVTAMPHYKDGFITISDKAGIGTELVPDVTDKHPPIPRTVAMRSHLDGSLVDQ